MSVLNSWGNVINQYYFISFIICINVGIYGGRNYI